MKNIKFLFYMLLMFGLGACSLSKSVGVNEVDDDVYWSTKDEPKSGTDYRDLEKWNKSNKGPNNSSIDENGSSYVPATESNAYSVATANDERRAQEAYQAWVAKREYNQNPNIDTNRKNSLITQELESERDSRRFGSERQYYYDDPYYNSLSPYWSWTSFYTPIVRPGFYNWAPGWNIGLSWNNYSGFNYGIGYNFGWGGFNSYYGYHPYAYHPWGYSPYGFYGYNPWYSPYYGGWGYSPWNYGYGNPYGYGCNYGWRNNYYGYGNHGYGKGNDVVSNRPLFRPRNSMGSSVPATYSRPGAVLPDGMATRPNRPGANEVISPNNGNQPNMVRPNTNTSARPDQVYRPARPSENVEPNNLHTNRPGGDLRYDNSGRPVYVSPNNNRPGSSNAPDNSYSNRPGGDLKSGPDGRPVYVPTRPRDYGSNSTTPGSSYYNDNNTARPARPDNSGGNVQPRNYSNESTPRSRDYSPSPSRPGGGGGGGTPRSSGGGGGNSSGSSGGGGRSRPR